MKRVLQALLLSFALFNGSVQALDKIVPVYVETPVAISVSPTDVIVPVPAGATAIVGWGGWIFSIGASSTIFYTAIEFWHNGGTPHQLDIHIFDPKELPWHSRATVFLPAGAGHSTTDTDSVFLRVKCRGLPAGSAAVAPCFAAGTFYFLVQ